MGADLDPRDIDSSFKRFSLIYCGVIVTVCIFPLLIIKNMTKIVKINSYGIYCVSVLLIFELVFGIYSLSVTDFSAEYKKNIPGSDKRFLYLFSEKPCTLLGTLSMGFFSHSILLPIMSSNEKPENNHRDLFLGYLCVAITYIVIGIFGYIAFIGKEFKDELEFYDNWFRFFNPNNLGIIILRLLNVFQLVSVYPVIAHVIRLQFFGTFFKTANPKTWNVIIFAGILSFFSWVILYFFADSLGKLMGIIGAVAGFFLIYLIPLSVWCIYYYRRHPSNLEELQQAKLRGDINLEEYNMHIDPKDNFGFSEKPYSKVKNVAFYVSQVLILLIGVFVAVIQFAPINIFGIHLK